MGKINKKNRIYVPACRRVDAVQELIAVNIWFPAAALVLGGILAGLIVERVILPSIVRYRGRIEREAEILIANALRGIAFVWCVAIGLYGATLSTPMAPEWAKLSQRLLAVVAIGSVTLVAARLAAGVVGLYSRHMYRRGHGSEILSPTIITNFTQLLVFVVGTLIVLQSLGIAVTPILTALGVGGLAVALALQETLSNLFSGLYIITARQTRPGDYVKLNTGEEGTITDITWRNTKLREGPNNMIIVPNAKLASATVTNYYEPDREVAVPVRASVSYESDLAVVERTALDVARQVLREAPGSVPDFEPVLRYHTFGDASIEFTVVLRAQDVGSQDAVKHAFVKRLHERYRAEGIRFRSWVASVPRDAGLP